MTPTAIKLRRTSRVLEVSFDDGTSFALPFEYLRVYSPSAEVRGHGPGQETLQLGKHEVGIRAVEPVGNYAVKLVFADAREQPASPRGRARAGRRLSPARVDPANPSVGTPALRSRDGSQAVRRSDSSRRGVAPQGCGARAPREGFTASSRGRVRPPHGLRRQHNRRTA